MNGRHLIVDFDGTLAELPVDWESLRKDLRLNRISDLWRQAVPDWSRVDDAESAAARIAKPVMPVIEVLRGACAIAVLTSNASSAVEVFLLRFPELRAHVKLIVGRHEIGGPKTDFEVFQHGFQLCRLAIADPDRLDPDTYIGNEIYELDFARRLGAIIISVADIRSAPQGQE